MNFLSQSVRARLVITSIILILLIVGGMGFAWYSLNNIETNMEDVTDKFLPLSSTMVGQLNREIVQGDLVLDMLESDEEQGVSDSDSIVEPVRGAAHEEKVAAVLAYFDYSTARLTEFDKEIKELIKEENAEDIASFKMLEALLEKLLVTRVDYRLAIETLLNAAQDTGFGGRADELFEELGAARGKSFELLKAVSDNAQVFILKETSQAAELSQTASLFIIYIAAGVIFLVVLLSISSLRSVSRPVSTISAVLEKIRSGNLQARTGFIGGDELQTLGLALDNMLDNMLDERDTSRQLNESVMKMLRSVSVLGKGDLTKQIPIAEDITGALGDAINQMVENMVEILQLVTESSDNVLGVSRNVNSMAQSGKESVVKNTQAMNEIRHTIQETAKRIKRLGERSQDINGIVKVINDIAERTSVLALNANMQAAAAGEAGRGFMVVANEVQRLAESSQEATKQIGKLVHTIQTETGDTIVAMDKGIEEVVKGAELAEEAATQMDKTVQTIENLNRVGAQLKASVSAFKLPDSA